ncbi:hypothetical protein PUN28_011041 [Cardiocondyla obscurior]|uniref:Uncharacterized protein n=1 Tax=Cardiocondyla obscurior TaxID=286306 RepID=A0AAW2FL24_9HYME
MLRRISCKIIKCLVLRGGGGLGKTSCFGGATSTIVVAVTPPLRIKPVSQKRQQFFTFLYLLTNRIYIFLTSVL